jgi:cephalosporin hydroxylase
MEHFYRKINGWFNFDNIYKLALEQSSDGAHFVEVGSWYGKSSCYMAVEILNSGKKIKFDCVDTWLGSEERLHKEDTNVQQNTLFDRFLENIEPVKHIVTPIRMASVEAASTYQDQSLDFVFIDAAHDYKNVMADLTAWYPKVKAGKLMAGHDYNFKTVKKAVDEFAGIHSLEVRPDGHSWVFINK